MHDPFCRVVITRAGEDPQWCGLEKPCPNHSGRCRINARAVCPHSPPCHPYPCAIVAEIESSDA